MNTDTISPTNEMINKALNVNECKTMHLGATLIDTDPSSGRISDIPDVACSHVWSPINALMLYPVAEDYEKNATDKKEIDLSMSCAWMTGLTPMRRGMPTPARMTTHTRNWLAGRSVNTTDQLFRSRPDDTLISIFANMKWYGSNTRIISKEQISNVGSYDKLVSRSHISKSWLENPIAVRYVVNITLVNEDYFYVIGGSDDIIGDDLAAIPMNLTSMYDQIKSLKAEIKKSSIPKKMKDDDAAGEDPKFLWYAYDKNSTDPTIRARLLAKKLLRTIEGIIFIRNYLAYAKNGIGISEIEEVVGVDANTGLAIFKTIEIEKILERYDTIYAYCKNLCYIYKDIGAGDIM